MTSLIVAGLLVAALPDADSETRTAATDLNSVEAAESTRLARREIARYELSLADEQGRPLELRAEPVFRWTNQLNRRFYGDVYLWTDEERPAAVVSITNVFGSVQKMEAEFHSLSREELRATRDDSPFWSPASAGIEWLTIENSPEVAETSRGRLLQMRTIARRLEVRSSTDDGAWSLRLLPNPVYRYESHETAATDGAMFAFAKGTDPDLFLLLEVQESDGHTEWRAAFARFTGHAALEVVDGDEVVWSAPKLTAQEIRNPERAYFTMHPVVSD